MGDRIGVIRRVLAPLTEVRILVPQPKSILFQGKKQSQVLWTWLFLLWVLPGRITL